MIRTTSISTRLRPLLFFIYFFVTGTTLTIMLRMPPGLLSRHLAIKAWRGLMPERESRPVPEI